MMILLRDYLNLSLREGGYNYRFFYSFLSFLALVQYHANLSVMPSGERQIAKGSGREGNKGRHTERQDLGAASTQPNVGDGQACIIYT